MAYAMRDPRTKKLTGRWRADAVHKAADGSELTWRKVYASKSEAEGAEAYFRATGNPPPGSLSAPVRSFRAVAEDFKRNEPEWLSKHDGRTNAQRLFTVVEFLGDRDITHVRKPALIELVTWLRKRPARYAKARSNRTLIRYLDAAYKVLRYAHSVDLIQGLPERPKIMNDGATRTALGWAQERAILSAMEEAGKPLDAFYARVLSATGMRCGELDELRPEQVELPEQRENTGFMLTKEQTKTKEPRWVPLVPELARKLKALLASGVMPKRAQVYETFKRAMKSVGDESGATLHCLRHTTVTRLLESGADGMDVAAIVGHSVPLTTGRYYHPNRSHLFRVAEKVQHPVGEIASGAEVVPLIDNRKSA